MENAFKNLIKVVVSQVPILAVAKFWWTDVEKNPVAAAVFALVYEFLVFAFGFGKKIWSQFEPELLKATTDWIRNFVLNFSPGFQKRYNTQVRFDHRVFNVSGLRTQGSCVLDVEQVFVELKIAPSHIQKANTDPLAFKDISGSEPIWEFLRRMKNNEGIALSIIGPPGCGKTTMLQHIALTFASNKQRRYRLNTLIPIMLFLREHAKTISDTSPSLGELVQSHFSSLKRYSDMNIPAKWFEKQLRTGKCIVMLDGLDEVADEEQRRAVSKWTDEQVRLYPQCRFILTARPQGYRDAPLTQAHILEIMPFKPEQVERFIRNWYLANKLISYGKDDVGVRQDAEQKTQDLLKRLRGQPALSGMTVNPLLLTMIAIVHNYRGALPGKRVELYDEICAVMLGHWGKAKGIEESLTAKQKRAVLQPLAAYMMKKSLRTISIEEATRIISSHLKQVGVSDKNVLNFLRGVQAGSGIMSEKEAGIWSFAHLTFQEYLCAVHWHETGRAEKLSQNEWKWVVSNSWWHETLRLYASQRDATNIAKACLEIKSISSLILANQIREEALKLDEIIRKELEKILEKNLESENIELRHIAAEVLLNRRLKNPFSQIDEGIEVDSNLITYAEYQLFLDDLPPKEDRHPYHWIDIKFSKGMAKKPVVGIGLQDAQSFCNWLTMRCGEKYRLPKRDEITRFSINISNEIGIWGHEGRLIGLSSEIETKLINQLSNLSNLPISDSMVNILASIYSFQFDKDAFLSIIKALKLSSEHFKYESRLNFFEIFKSMIHYQPSNLNRVNSTWNCRGVDFSIPGAIRGYEYARDSYFTLYNLSEIWESPNRSELLQKYLEDKLLRSGIPKKLKSMVWQALGIESELSKLLGIQGGLLRSNFSKILNSSLWHELGIEDGILKNAHNLLKLEDIQQSSQYFYKIIEDELFNLGIFESCQALKNFLEDKLLKQDIGKKAFFRLTEQDIEKLKKKGATDDILSNLEELKYQDYNNESQFLKNIEKNILTNLNKEGIDEDIISDLEKLLEDFRHSESQFFKAIEKNIIEKQVDKILSIFEHYFQYKSLILNHANKGIKKQVKKDIEDNIKKIWTSCQSYKQHLEYQMSESERLQVLLLYDISCYLEYLKGDKKDYSPYSLALRIAEYVYMGSHQDEDIKQAALHYYWFLRIIQAREEGKLLAWEGIRLVRERG